MQKAANGEFKIETAAVDSLVPHPRNYREHPEDQLDHIRASINRHGMYRNIVISKDDVILAGHGVVQALKELGVDKVPVRRVDYNHDDDEAMSILIGDNEISHLGVIDDRVLSELLKEISDAGKLKGTGWSKEKLANLVLVTRDRSEIPTVNYARHWVGLPEYAEGHSVDPIDPRLKLIVRFDTIEHKIAFIEKAELKATIDTKFVYVPHREREALQSLRWDSDEFALSDLTPMGYVDLYEQITADAATSENVRSLLRKEESDIQQTMEAGWYESLAAGKPDYGIYSRPEYLVEALYCFCTYSSKYIKFLLQQDLPAPATIVDLGCGIGFSTALLKEAYPTAVVHGTQVEGPQKNIANLLGKRFGFTVSEQLPASADLIFASEYFEHFLEPIYELRKLYDTCKPKTIVFANTFGAKSTGHFHEYQTPGGIKKGREVTKAFHDALKEYGYERLAQGYNGRPQIWQR